jgi:hypothetical protein
MPRKGTKSGKPSKMATKSYENLKPKQTEQEKHNTQENSRTQNSP